MKKQHTTMDWKTQGRLLVVLGLAFLSACGGEDVIDIEGIQLSAFEETMDENPTNGQVIGTLEATGPGDLYYSLLVGADAAAFAVDELTGVVSVADASLFDYETSTSLTAQFQVTDSTSTEIGSLTVTLNDVEEANVGLITEEARFPAAQSAAAVVFLDKMWMIGGISGLESNNEIWTSTDGITWTQVTFNWVSGVISRRHSHTLTVYQDKLWLIGGQGGSTNTQRYADVYSTTDGVNWFQETNAAAFGARASHATVVFQDKLWVIAGLTSPNGAVQNSTYTSVDGATWEEVPGIPFSGRFKHSALVYDDKIWVLGGTRGNRTDVIWSSADGVTWEEVTPNEELPRPEGHTSVVFDGKMWLIGVGGDQVWSSTDGANWTQENTPAFSSRTEHASVVYDNKIWLFGGYDGANRNDVWTIAEIIE